MLNLTRRGLVVSAAAAAAFGLQKPLRIVSPASAAPLEPSTGFHRFNVGAVEVTAVYDGIWRKPHDPDFIRNASVEETKEALSRAGLTAAFVPIPLTVFVLKIGDRLIMCDAGSGVGQWQANATNLPANMKAAGIDYTKIGTVLVSHFHPDHVWGLMERGTNAPVFPNAELVVNAVEYNWWTDPSRVEKLPEGRRAAAKRIADVFPAWKNWTLVEDGAEVAPGVRIVAVPGHTPGHSAYVVASGGEAADGLGRHHVRARAPRPPSGLAGQLRPGRADSDREPPQADRPRHRRQDDDLRLAFPVPGHRDLREGRERLCVHARQSSLNRGVQTMTRFKRLGAFALAAILAIAGPDAGRSFAVDNMASGDGVDLTSVRAKIKAKDYAAAKEELRNLVEDAQHPDVYSLLGFTLRKTGDYATSLAYYTKALELEPGHKAAREYLGELFLETDKLDLAKDQLAALERLCPAGCEERDDLQRAIDARARN